MLRNSHLPGLAVAALALLAGCGSSSSAPSGPPDLSLSDLLSAPERLLIGDKTIVLETGLWRNLMPSVGVPIFGRPPVQARLTLSELDLNEIPPDLDPRFVWFVHEDDVCASELPIQRIEDTPPFEVAKLTLFCGELDFSVSMVDVVVGVVDAQGELYLVRAPDQ